MARKEKVKDFKGIGAIKARITILEDCIKTPEVKERLKELYEELEKREAMQQAQNRHGR